MAATTACGILANAAYPADLLHQNVMIAANVIDAALMRARGYPLETVRGSAALCARRTAG